MEELRQVMLGIHISSLQDWVHDWLFLSFYNLFRAVEEDVFRDLLVQRSFWPKTHPYYRSKKQLAKEYAARGVKVSDIAQELWSTKKSVERWLRE